ncbi:Uncharacterised protein [Chlamydia trachomatis]|nr:Uncharacterised protein [Chlamydia trachomatis]CRH47327.1 Uncharacterised protein [Chlamydia trachomatis]CRH55016.1 Uncharacterised protein [Chlamydia trachomatis]
MANNKLNKLVEEELINKHFIQKIDKSFKSDLGISVTMYSKYFIPKSELSEYQLKQLDSLKKDDYKM